MLTLSGTSPEQAAKSADRLRERLAATSFDPIAIGLGLTFSAGLSACAAGEAIEACIERAGQTTYRAKAQGRDCTGVA